MKRNFLSLSLRDLFGLIFLTAIALGWGVERTRLAKELAEFKQTDWFSAPRTREYQPSSESFERSAIVLQLRLLSNADLLSRFQQKEHLRHEFGCILLEMIQRKMHQELEAACDKEEFPGSWLHTAACRAAGKPDPVSVQLVVAQRDREGKPIDYPVIEATIQNNDPEKREIWWTLGGDYRGGRSERWRIELTDRRGERVPDSNFTSFLGGGILHPEKIGFGAQTSPTNLYARAFVSPPKSGRYRMQVLHAGEYIATDPDLEGIMVWKSEPVDVIVENRGFARQRRMALMPLLSVLIGSGILSVVGYFRGRYAPGASVNARNNWRPDWRAMFAVGLVLGLAVGWYLDVALLQRRIEAVRPDTHSDWTLRLADAK